MQANLRHLSLAAQTRYYTGLKSVEPNDSLPSHRNKSQETKSSNPRRNQNSRLESKTKHDTNQKSIQKFCEIHGKCNQSTAQCEVIKKQKNEYQDNKNNKDKNKQNNRPKYNTRSNAKKKEENNTMTNNNNNDASNVDSEINQIEEIFNVQDLHKKLVT